MAREYSLADPKELFEFLWGDDRQRIEVSVDAETYLAPGWLPCAHITASQYEGNRYVPQGPNDGRDAIVGEVCLKCGAAAEDSPDPDDDRILITRWRKP